MPNGDHQFDYKKLDDFFSPMADVLATFASRHNLRLTKYYHASPSWDFTFRHPRGGLGKIEVMRVDGESISLSCRWWHDDYALLTRFIKKHESAQMPVASQILNAELEKCLRMLLSWEFGSWDEEYGGNNEWSRNWTRDQFDALVEQYPTLRR